MITVWSVVTIAVSIYTVRIGDQAWHNLLSFFNWR